MKKPKNKQRKQLLKLLPIIRSIINNLAPYFPTPIEVLLRPGLAAVFDGTPHVKAILYDDRVREALLPFKGKHKRIDIEKLYHRVWKEDMRNYSLHNYKFDPSGRVTIDKDGHKIIRI